MAEFITFTDVHKIYKMGEVEIHAANGVSFEIQEGELAVIVGASGAGKTTTLNILGGIDRCDRGDIIVDGRNISKLSSKELIAYRRHDIGFVFQFYNLVANLTAKENVELATQICKDHMDPMEALEAVLAAEPGPDGAAFLWRDLPDDAPPAAMQRAFEAFCDSCDWWLDRISEFSAPEPEIPPMNTQSGLKSATYFLKFSGSQ